MSSTIINNPPKKAIRRAKESSTAKRAADVPFASDDDYTVPKDAEASKNGAASNELLQSLQPTHNESVKNNDRIEGETLKKLINRNFRSKTLVSIKTDYEAANIKVVDAITNRNCQSAQDVIKNIEAIMSYNNVINPVYLIHGTAEVQLEYLRSILDSNILALLKMVVPDWVQTDIAIKLNTQTDILSVVKLSPSWFLIMPTSFQEKDLPIPYLKI
ncbi:hypothetical protein ACTFIY_011721 [Dictyostelium cf. discoideum]